LFVLVARFFLVDDVRDVYAKVWNVLWIQPIELFRPGSVVGRQLPLTKQI